MQDGKVSEKPSGGGVQRRGSLTAGAYIEVAEGDTLCGLAKAYYGPNADCKKLRSHPCNAKLLGPLKAKQKVFFPDLKKADPKETQKVRVKIMQAAEEAQALRITTLLPREYGTVQDGCDYKVKVEDPFRPANAANAGITLDLVYPDLAWVPPAQQGANAQNANAQQNANALPIVHAAAIPAPELLNQRPFLVCPPRKIQDPASAANRRIVQNARTLALALNNSGESGTFRLVTEDSDRLERQADTLFVGELFASDPTGPKSTLGEPTAIVTEILDMKVRATYKLPSCKFGCEAAKEQGFLKRRVVKLGVRILRRPNTGDPPVVLPLPLTKKAQIPAGVAQSAVVDPFLVSKNVSSHTRRLFAQAGVQVEIASLEVCDSPSDMLAISDWDGLLRMPPPSHLAPNGKSAAAKYTVNFELTWQPAKVGGQAPAAKAYMVKVEIPQGSTPEATAKLIADAINIKITANDNAAPNNVALASPNPKQTNADQKSCDVVLRPPNGTMSIAKLTGASDEDQKIHVIHFPGTEANGVVLSNFPESFHICSPHFRLIMKGFRRGTEDVKVVVSTISGCAVASSDQTVDGFGIGNLRDFFDYRTAEEVRNSIIGANSMFTASVGRKTLFAHELGHVLIDMPGHCTTEDQLMFGVPKDSCRIINHLPAEPNWQMQVYDGVARRFSFAALGRVNGVARVVQEDPSIGVERIDDSPDPGFAPLSVQDLGEMNQSIRSVVTSILGNNHGVQLVDIARDENYFALRTLLMEGWKKYYDLRNTVDRSRAGGHIPALMEAFKTAWELDSDLRALLQGNLTVEQMQGRFGNDVSMVNKQQYCADWLALVLRVPANFEKFVGTSEWCMRAFRDDKIAGFTGTYTDGQRERGAFFVNIERYGKEGLRIPKGDLKQKGPNRGRHFYTALHEAMHLQSHQLRGFNLCPESEKPGGIAQNADWRWIIDEGATELFARIALHRGLKDLNNGPTIAYFGFHPDRYLPAYETVKNLVAQMANDVGLDLLARAYFLGEFEPFFDAIKTYRAVPPPVPDSVKPAPDPQQYPIRYNEAFWGQMGSLAPAPAEYMEANSTSNQTNNALSLKLPLCHTTADIFGWMLNGDVNNYLPHDPVNILIQKYLSNP